VGICKRFTNTWPLVAATALGRAGIALRDDAIYGVAAEGPAPEHIDQWLATCNPSTNAATSAQHEQWGSSHTQHGKALAATRT